MDNPRGSPFLRRAFVVTFYALAMAYLEAAVVAYFQRALHIDPHSLFPVRDASSLGGLGSIEVGREAATIVMLATVGWLAGRQGLERFAWMSVAFGIWDLAYYGWLWVFIGWPTGMATYDLLFLIPVPWVAPVWAPMVVSLALVTFGLVIARRLRGGKRVSIRLKHIIALCGGGLTVIASFTLDARRILDGGLPAPFVWPVFLAGMALAVVGAISLCGFSWNPTSEETTRGG